MYFSRGNCSQPARQSESRRNYRKERIAWKARRDSPPARLSDESSLACRETLSTFSVHNYESTYILRRLLVAARDTRFRLNVNRTSCSSWMEYRAQGCTTVHRQHTSRKELLILCTSKFDRCQCKPANFRFLYCDPADF